MLTQTVIPPSVMHAHVVNIVTAEVRDWERGQKLRILDVGCGDGRFIGFAHQRLPIITERPVEIYGFDVSDAGLQRSDFFARTIDGLTQIDPTVNWPARLQQVTSGDPWPFSDGWFDIVVSNQVGEHVRDISRFLAEAARVTRTGGFSVHVFPLRGYLVEGHTGIPFAHRILSHDFRETYLRTVARFGLSRIGPLRQNPKESATEFATTRSDYVSFETCYHTWPELAQAACAAGWRASYRYTPNVYLLKAGYLAGVDLANVYRRPRPIVDALTFRPLSRISSVTVFLERKHTYDADSV
ncbi:class I SAM-dependent methyltransferase [Frankia sp. Cas4]|uniref:class I SAM-dependent methyltransferase n=1 Tax=Frankia sp. Cas4 TaxID=3073927 RepID=UPI002AD40AB3|nr:class I SAM-dependent methyltransferase [Frankia sp. Cas4]